MENIRIKNLILLVIVIFSLFFSIINDTSAHYRNGRYDSSYWLDSTDLIDDDYPYYDYNYYDPNYNYYIPTYYQQPTSNTYYTPTTQPDTYVVNNYYYQNPNTSTTPTTNTNTTSTIKTNTDTTTKNDNTNNENNDDTSNENSLDSNNTDEQTDGNGITALAINGSGGFMPSSIWQWMLVVILILTIIVISRMLVKKPSPADHDLHAGHPAH